MHLIHSTGSGPDGTNCVAWTSIKVPKHIQRNLMDRPLLCVFRASSGIEDFKISPLSNNADITGLNCADSIEQYDRRDNIRIFGVEINDEAVYECVVEVANDTRVTISKQSFSVCHRGPSTNLSSRPIIAKFVRSETKFRVMTHKT